MKKSIKRRKKIQEDNEMYTITPKGVLSCEFGIDSDIPEQAMDALELHARRHFQKDSNFGAIVFAEDGPHFVSLERHED